MGDVYKAVVGSLIRTLLISAGTWLMTKHMLGHPVNESTIDMLTAQLLNGIPIIIAQVWSYLQKVYQAKIAKTALESAPFTSMETVKARVGAGMGAKLRDAAAVALLLTAAGLSFNACATGGRPRPIPPVDPGPVPVASRADRVLVILTDANWGVKEACTLQWLQPPLCTTLINGLDASIAAVKHDPLHAAEAGLRTLQGVEYLLPADSRARPYIDAALRLLRPLLGGV